MFKAVSVLIAAICLTAHASPINELNPVNVDLKHLDKIGIKPEDNSTHIYVISDNNGTVVPYWKPLAIPLEERQIIMPSGDLQKRSTFDFYGYNCYNCGCDANFVHSLTFNKCWSGCFQIGSGSASVGAHDEDYKGGKQLTCSVYPSNDCTGVYQTVAPGWGQTWTCDNTKNGWLHSAQCYYGC